MLSRVCCLLVLLYHSSNKQCKKWMSCCRKRHLIHSFIPGLLFPFSCCIVLIPHFPLSSPCASSCCNHSPFFPFVAFLHRYACLEGWVWSYIQTGEQVAQKEFPSSIMHVCVTKTHLDVNVALVITNDLLVILLCISLPSIHLLFILFCYCVRLFVSHHTTT